MRILFAVLLLTGSATAAAAPYRPADDALILERIPPGLPTTTRVPQSAATAAQLARADIERSRRDADPRFLGYAEGVLQPWWTQAEPPPEILLLRATIRQARHQFDAALADLDALLRHDPANAQAWLTRATILRVQGQPRDAATACDHLDGLAPAFYVTVCQAAALSLAGELAPATEAMDEVAGSAPDPFARSWWLAERADMARRAGDTTAALAFYTRAGAEQLADPQLLAAHAQLLLDLGRVQEAATLAGAQPQSDLLRLRRAQALRALGTPDAALEAALADTYLAARRRGEELHLREEARFELSVRGDAARALELAQTNWRNQRENDDARLLLEAALAAGNGMAADGVLAWMGQTGVQDPALAALAKRWTAR